MEAALGPLLEDYDEDSVKKPVESIGVQAKLPFFRLILIFSFIFPFLISFPSFYLLPFFLLLFILLLFLIFHVTNTFAFCLQFYFRYSCGLTTPWT